MSVRRSLIPLALLASTAAALSCGDPSPSGPGLGMPVAKQGGTPNSTTGIGLVRCSQSYDSVTQLIGPTGGVLAVGPHYLWVDTMALLVPVSITAVAPKDTVRWLRFQPDGLEFRTNGAGRSAILYASYKGCDVSTSDLRVAQVTDSLSILGYLEEGKPVKGSWSQANQFVAGVLDHFSNYAIAW